LSDPRAPASAADVLDHLALTAPFNPDGPLRALVSVASGIIPGMDVPTMSRMAPKALPGSVDYQRFARVVLAELSGAGTGIERVMAAWGLTVTDVARLFGVRRQAVQQWLDEGVPGARQPKLHTIREIADLLKRNLLPERIPGIVRAPSEAYDGRSMLELIAMDRQDELLDSVRRSFDWAWSA
jgi:transcriptional regulator with XRE-family HTH domain